MPCLAMPKIKAFVPARDVSLSRQFYQDLGFTLASGLLPFRGGELPAAGPLPRGAGRALHDAHPDEGRGRLVGSRGGKPGHPRYGIRVTEIATKPWHMKECSPYDLSNVL